MTQFYNPKGRLKRVNFFSCARGFYGDIVNQGAMACTGPGSIFASPTLHFKDPGTGWIVKEREDPGKNNLQNWTGTIDGKEYTIAFSGLSRRYWTTDFSGPSIEQGSLARGIQYCNRGFLLAPDGFGGVAGACIRKQANGELWCYITLQSGNSCGRLCGNLSVFKHIFKKDLSGDVYHPTTAPEGWQQLGSTVTFNSFSGGTRYDSAWCDGDDRGDCAAAIDWDKAPQATPAFWNASGTGFTMVGFPPRTSSILVGPSCNGGRYYTQLFTGSVTESSFSVSHVNAPGFQRTTNEVKTYTKTGDTSPIEAYDDICLGLFTQFPQFGDTELEGTELWEERIEGWNYIASDYQGDTRVEAKIERTGPELYYREYLEWRRERSYAGCSVPGGSSSYINKEELDWDYDEYWDLELSVTFPGGSFVIDKRDSLWTEDDSYAFTCSIPSGTACADVTCSGSSSDFQFSYEGEFTSSFVHYMDLRNSGNAVWYKTLLTEEAKNKVINSPYQDYDLCSITDDSTEYIVGGGTATSSILDAGTESCVARFFTIRRCGGESNFTDMDTIPLPELTFSNTRWSRMPGCRSMVNSNTPYITWNDQGQYFLNIQNHRNAGRGLGGTTIPLTYCDINGEYQGQQEIWDLVMAQSWVSNYDTPGHWWGCANIGQSGNAEEYTFRLVAV